MQELLKVITHNGKQAINARDLHAALGVGRDFSTWIKDRFEKYSFVCGKDYSIISGRIFDPPTSGNQGGRGGDRRSIDYLLTITTAKEIAMVENNIAGQRIRQYLIRVEELWRSQSTEVAVVKTPLEKALVIKQALEYQQEMIEQLQAENAELKPKAAFSDLAIQSENVMSMNHAAKVLKLGFGDRTLFKSLREKGILMADNVPYQEYINRGYFVVDENPILIGANIQIKRVTKVTQKGMMWLARVFGKVPENDLFGFDGLQKTS